MAVKYFLDTYAFVEIIKGNPNYDKFLDAECYTTILNLYELYFRLLWEFGKKEAETQFQRFLPLKIEVKDEYIPEACEFKFKFKDKNVSYVDALGYIIAKENDFKFLTGDGAFIDISNVEFVK